MAADRFSPYSPRAPAPRVPQSSAAAVTPGPVVIPAVNLAEMNHGAEAIARMEIEEVNRHPSNTPASPASGDEDDPQSGDSDDEEDDNFDNMSTAPTAPTATAMMASRASATLIRTFNAAAGQAGLDDKRRAWGIKFCDLGQSEGFVADLVSRLELHQNTDEKLDTIIKRLTAIEARGRAADNASEAVKELRNWLKDNAERIVIRSSVQAYTRTEDSAGDTIFHALTCELWRLLFAAPRTWRDRLIGANYGTTPSTNPADPVRKVVGEKAKAARTWIQGHVFTHIQVPGAKVQAPQLPVQDLNSLTYVLKKPVSVAGGVQLTRDGILDAVAPEEFARYALLRCQLVDWALNRTKYAGQSQWAVIDGRLEELRGHTPRYQYGYHVLCLEDDRARFDGSRTFPEICAAMAAAGESWDMPNASRMCHILAKLEERFGDEPAPGEAPYRVTATE